MKKILFFLAFITGMVMKSQVVVDTVFTTTEEISFVSDNGNGTYTVSGPGAGSDGFLAIYDEGSQSWEYKNFPAKMNLGSVHNAEVLNAVSIGGYTYSTGKVANSATNSWKVVRKYTPGDSNYSIEKIIKNASVRLYKSEGDLYGVVGIHSNTDLMNSGWNLSGIGEYLVKFDQQDLSLEWSYQVCSSWNNGEWRVNATDNLISTNVAYRYAIQPLPNGNIAVTVHRASGMEHELWEFDPNTGQKLGVIDNSYTDYDRNGTEEMQYRFHRWKVVDGVLFHEFWNDPNNSQDQNIGHWEKLEVPGYTPGGTTPWDPAQLQVTAVSDWGTNDSFRTPVIDFHVDADGMIHWYGRSMTKKFALYKNEVDHSGALNGLDVRDEWVSESGETMMMTPHSLVRVTYGEQFPNHIEAVAGNNVVEARNGQVYHNGWHQRAGEATIVLNHSAMPQVGDTPDASWWSIPSGFHFEGVLPIKMETRPGDEDHGKLYFDVGALEDNQPSTPSELILRVWVVDANTVGIPETEINGLSLYPNPVSSFLTVEADEGVDAVRIYNMSGIMVEEAGDNTRRVYTGNLPAGVYVVEITAGDKISCRVVVKR